MGLYSRQDVRFHPFVTDSSLSMQNQCTYSLLWLHSVSNLLLKLYLMNEARILVHANVGFHVEPGALMMKGDWEAWRNRSLAREDIVHLLLDGMVVKTRWTRRPPPSRCWWPWACDVPVDSIQSKARGFQ